ncbi:MAG: hypothetical protein EBY79_00905 [Actinobacteria bacterium]|nr:hypothetical protein [Acidimicrobiia bacterium]NDH91654.1 hypothetical protein [Actinomycetota bacterium]
MSNETDTTTLTAIDPAAAELDATAEPGVSTEPDAALNEPAPRFTQRWQCPDCDNGITLHVRVIHAPICNNKARHSRRHIDMKKQKKGNPQ